MNTNSDEKIPMQLMPGLFRLETSSGVKITYYWYGGLGSLSNKMVEGFIFLFGLVAGISSLNGIIRLVTGRIGLLSSLLPICFFIIGLALVYRGIAFIINRSVFTITSLGLSVRHRPLPFPGATDLDLQNAEISGIEWQKVGHSSHTGYSSGRVQSGYSATFDVLLTANSGKSFTLLSGFRAREYAFAISSEISKYLNK